MQSKSKKPSKAAAKPQPEKKTRKTVEVADARTGPSLKALTYSPQKNPLVDPSEVSIRKKKVVTGTNQTTDKETGEISGSNIFVTEEIDENEFVKVFAEGIKQAFALSKTAYRVWHLVLKAYEETPMSGGFADAVYLKFFDGGLAGEAVGMSDRSFNLGLRELLQKNFISPKLPNVYWVNPALFFKGNRVTFIKQYVKKQSEAANDKRTKRVAKKKSDDVEYRESLEKNGQQRLPE